MPLQACKGRNGPSQTAAIGELTEIVGSDRTTVSKHLAVLRANDIVADLHTS